MSTTMNVPNQLTFSDLPSEIYHDVIAAYADIHDLARRRYLNRETYHRYQESADQLWLNFELLEYAVRNRDIALIRDWLAINDNHDLFVGPDFCHPDYLRVLECFARCDPDLAKILLREPEFCRRLVGRRNLLLQEVAHRRPIGFGLMLSSQTLNFLRVVLRLPMMVDLLLLPWLRSNDGSMGRLLTAVAFMRDLEIYDDLVKVNDLYDFAVPAGRIQRLREGLTGAKRNKTEAVDGVLRCGRCESKEVRMAQRRARGDELLINFGMCTSCGYRWKS